MLDPGGGGSYLVGGGFKGAPLLPWAHRQTALLSRNAQANLSRALFFPHVKRHLPGAGSQPVAAHGMHQPVIVVTLLMYFLFSPTAFPRGSCDNDRTSRSLSQKLGIIAPFQRL